MSLNIYMTATFPSVVFETDITHNLNTMANKVPVGNEITLYTVLWRPEEVFGAKTIAYDLIKFLDTGLTYLQNNKDKLRKYNPSNGWGDYDGLVAVVKDYLRHCEEYPTAIISVSR